MTTSRALVRRPGPRLDEGIVTHIERQAVDVALAVRQWRAYVEALASAGWQTIEVPPADDCPDSVFIEDTMVVYGDLAVMASPAAESRRGELSDAARSVEGQGYRLARIEPPGTLDGATC